MADNTRSEAVVNNGVLWATDECLINSVTVHVPFCKLAFGALDTATIVSTANGLPVQFASGQTTAVTNAGVFAVQESGSALVALQLLDNLVLLEDAAHASGDPGVQLLAVRKLTPANLSGTDGDYEPLQMSAGRLWVDASGVTLTVGSHQVTNAGTFAVQVDGAALTALQLIDDPVIADDAAFTPATSKVMMAGFQHDNVTPDSVDEGDAGAARMSANRCIFVNIRDNAGNERGLNVDASGNITEANSAAIKTAVEIIDDWDETDRAKVNIIVGVAGITAGAGAVAAGTPRVTLASDDPAVASLGVVDDWDEADRAKVNLIVGQAGVAAGAGAVGATVVRTTLASDDPAVTALQIVDDWDNAASDGASVSGDIAHDAVDAGEPVKLGAKAENALSGATAVADGDRTNLFADLDGVLIVKTHAAHGDYVNGNASNTDGASTQVIAAQAAGIRTYLTDVTITNTSATNTFVELKDGATVKWTMAAPANSSVTHHFQTPLPGTAATAWNFDMGAAVTTAYCSMSGFLSKV